MSFNEKLSYTEFVVENPTTDFNIGFSFTEDIDKLGLLIDDVDANEAGYTYRLKNSMTVEVTPPVASGIVRIYRETNLDSTRHVFKAAAKFVAANMDTNFTQLLHSQQEVRDQTNAFYNRIDIQINDFTTLVSDVQGEFQAVREQVNSAETTADAANKTSQDALDVANGIANTAQDAFDTAERAENTANGIAGTANQAMTVAKDAEVQAADAVIKAANATTIAEGIAGTANEANMVAYESRELAVEAKNIANEALAQTTLKPATITTLGGIKVGAGLAITTDGVLSNTSGMPLGVPMWHNGTEATIPTGHVAFNGQVLSRTAYPAMWAKVQSTFQKVTDAVWLANPNQRGCYSTGDGSTTFRMPDLNGVQTNSIKAPVLRGHGGGTVAGEVKTVGQMDTDAMRRLQGTTDNLRVYSTGNTYGVFGKLAGSSTTQSGFSSTNGYTAEFDNALVTPTAPENRMNSVYGIWICRVGDATTEIAEPTKHAVLTGGNTFNGSQKVVGNLEVSGTLNANIKPLLNAVGDAPIYPLRAKCCVTVTAMTIVFSQNIKSVARISSAVYEVEFLTAMPNTQYGILYDCTNFAAGQTLQAFVAKTDPLFAQTTTKFRFILAATATGALTEPSPVNITFGVF